jgi:mRNA-degrading endonuclease HigB of HigAB toxin-antitoxin module
LIQEHINIDINNNIHVYLNKKINGLLTQENLIFNLGEKVFEIPCNKLKIVKDQDYIFKEIGILNINIHDIYDSSKRSDIIVHLKLFET